MDQVVATTGPQQLEALQREDLENFVTFFIKDQMFGIPVLKVQDILTPDKIAPIPLAPPEVEGSINLRGRIVTVIDMRERLGLGHRNTADKPMGVTVEQNNELYTLLVDRVGDVVSLSADLYEDNPSTLDTLWREFALGVYRLDGPLMVVLDVDRILDISYTAS
jgi:purine-binding chemotaxis protein CheW